MSRAFINSNRLPESFLRLAQLHFDGLAMRLHQMSNQQNAPLFVGINGSQGSGKSTLAAYLAEQFKQLNVVVMSLDDFYLSRDKRSALAVKVHPLFATRGVPGTHDVELLASVLRKLKKRETDFLIPRFNKATDEPCPQEEWLHIKQPADIVIVEGWCWGISPQTETTMQAPVNGLERTQDPAGIWRRFANQQLKVSYQPLYRLFDYWIALLAPSFDSVHQWRLEQEQKLADSLPADAQSNLMSSEQIQAFIQYFQRLTEHGLKTLPAQVDTGYQLNENRQIISVSHKVERGDLCTK